MKHLLFFALLLVSTFSFGQTIEKSESIVIYDVVPTVPPCEYCSERAFVRADNTEYWWDGDSWEPWHDGSSYQTFLVKDSIMVTTNFGVEISRDTIRGGTTTTATGIYSGDGDIPNNTTATVEDNGAFSIESNVSRLSINRDSAEYSIGPVGGKWGIDFYPQRFIAGALDMAGGTIEVSNNIVNISAAEFSFQDLAQVSYFRVNSTNVTFPSKVNIPILGTDGFGNLITKTALDIPTLDPGNVFQLDDNVQSNLQEAGANIGANALVIQSLNTLSGVSALDNNLGSFLGAVIPTGSNTKEALQALETRVETVKTVYFENLDSLRVYTGFSVNDIGITKGFYFPDGVGSARYRIAASLPTDVVVDNISAILLTNGVFALLQPLGSGFDISQFGATGADDSDNDSPSIVAAFNYARATKLTDLTAPASAKYLCKTDETINISNIRLRSGGGRLVASSDYTGFKEFLNASGEVGDYYEVTSTMNRGDQTITVGIANAANFAKGDIIKIKSTEYFHVDYTRITAAGATGASLKGEMNEVASVVGGVINLLTPIDITYGNVGDSVAVVQETELLLDGIKIETEQDPETTTIRGLEVVYGGHVDVSNCEVNGFRTNVQVTNDFHGRYDFRLNSDQGPAMIVLGSCSETKFSGDYHFNNSEIEIIGGQENVGGGVNNGIVFENMNVFESGLGEVFDSHPGSNRVTIRNSTFSGGNNTVSFGGRSLMMENVTIRNANTAFQTRDEKVSIGANGYFSLPIEYLRFKNVVMENVEDGINIKKNVDEFNISSGSIKGDGTFIIATTELEATKFNTFSVTDYDISNLLVRGAFKVPTMEFNNVRCIEDTTYTTNDQRWAWFSEQTDINTLKLDDLTYHRRERTTGSGDWLYIEDDANIVDFSLNNSIIDSRVTTANGNRRFIFSNSSNFLPNIYINNTTIIDTNSYNRMFYCAGSTGGFISVSNSKILRTSTSLRFNSTGYFLVDNANEWSDDRDTYVGNFFSLIMMSGSYTPSVNGRVFMTGSMLVGDGSPEGVVYAERGAEYSQSNSNKIWVKTGGSGDNVGWQ